MWNKELRSERSEVIGHSIKSWNFFFEFKSSIKRYYIGVFKILNYYQLKAVFNRLTSYPEPRVKINI